MGPSHVASKRAKQRPSLSNVREGRGGSNVVFLQKCFQMGPAVAEHDELRERARAAGEQEQVRTNQRHLIDKILARYSAPFTVYRELAQNADDAEATALEILFYLDKSDGASGSRQIVHTVEVRNDGHPFQPQDWTRLCRIAEGNPDETKVGFFGVGFYSVFCLCEEPMVISGESSLVFGWNHDNLFTTRIPNDQFQRVTKFIFKLREPHPLPDVKELGGFLCSMLTFTRHLSNAKVSVGSGEILSLQKLIAPPDMVDSVPKWPFQLSSPHGLFTIQRAEKSVVQVRLTVHEGENWTQSTVFASQYTANLKSNPSKQLITQMQRVTKKKPPSECHVACLVASDESGFVGGQSEGLAAEILRGSFVPAENQGRVFIGFSTHQTTGCALHISAPVIPTVERESIDFVDPALRSWNQELLVCVGSLIRILYDDRMTKLDTLFHSEPTPTSNKHPEKSDQEPATPSGLFSQVRNLVTSAARLISSDLLSGLDETMDTDPSPLKSSECLAIAAMRAHTFGKSTPNPNVSILIKSGFFSGNKSTPLVITKIGVREGSACWLPYDGLESLLISTPVVRPRVLRGAEPFLHEIASHQGVVGLKQITIEVACSELRHRVLDEGTFVKFLKFIIRFKRRHPEIGEKEDGLMLQSITFSVKGVDAPLSTFKWFSPRNLIPSSLPMTIDTLPREISDLFTSKELQKELGWFQPLPLVRWLNSVDVGLIISNSAQRDDLFVFLNEEFKNQRNAPREVICPALLARLKEIPCIETNQGLRSPSEAHLPAVTEVFPDLPCVTSRLLRDLKLSSSFLVSLGVRNSVSLDLLFSSLEALRWDKDQSRLIKYLAGTQESLKREELARLRETKFLRSLGGQDDSLFAPGQLLFPSADNISLGLKVLERSSKKPLAPNSSEGRFLKNIGLRVDPELDELIESAGEQSLEPEKRARIILFMADHVESRYQSYKPSAVAVGFLPTDQGLQKPLSCFTCMDCKIMKFAVVEESIRSAALRLGVQEHPSSDLLVARLLETIHQLPVPEESLLIAMFEYLSGRMRYFDGAQWKLLKREPFIPSNGAFRRVSEVYLGSHQTVNSHDSSSLFEIVNFSGSANAFIARCGVREQPSLDEICTLLASDPKFVLSVRLKGDVDRYLGILRQVSSRFGELSGEVIRKMRKSSCLVGLRRRQDGASELCSSSQVSLIDDTLLEQLFDPLSAPLETGLEKLYESLGAQWISKETARTFTIVGEWRSTPISIELTQLIVERAPLILDGRKNPRLLASSLFPNKLSCWVVDNIVANLSYRASHSKQEVTSCVLPAKGVQAGLNLFVVEQFDFFDVGQALGNHLFDQCRLEDAFMISRMLETPLDVLKSRGFPVDRVLLQEPTPKVKISPPKGSLPAEQSGSVSPSGTHITSPQASSSDSRSSSHRLAGAGEPSLEGYTEILSNMFPNQDPRHIRRLLENESKDHLIAVSNKLADEAAHQESHNDEAAQPTTPEPAGTLARGKESRRTQNSGKGISMERFMKSIRMTGKPGISQGLGLRGTTSPAGVASPPDVLSQSVPSRGSDPALDLSHQNRLDVALQTGIRSCKPSQGPGSISTDDTLRPTHSGAELTGACEIVPGHDLVNFPVPTEYSSLPVFIRRRGDERGLGMVESVFWDSCEQFTLILRSLCAIFKLDSASVSIYYDESGRTIAFNAGRSIYCNLRFFASLHRHLPPSDPEPIFYWFIILCHGRIRSDIT